MTADDALGPDGLPPKPVTLRGRLEGWPALLSGFAGLYRMLGPTRRRVVVLTWHHVGREAFARQLAWLRARHEIVPLSEAFAAAAGQASATRHRVCLTFDDGVESFLDGPYPELRAAGVPATLFVAPGLLGTVPFWYEVAGAVARSDRTRVTWRGEERDLTPGRARDKSRAAMVRTLKRIDPPAAREAALAELLGALGVSRGDAGRGLPRIMTAAQLRTLDPAVVSVGGHTRSHACVAALTGDRLDDEIAGGREELRGMLQPGAEVADFAYPYGRPEDVSAEAAAAVRRAGFRAGYTTTKGDVSPGADTMMLPRVDLVGREGRVAVMSRAGGAGRWVKGLLGRTRSEG